MRPPYGDPGSGVDGEGDATEVPDEVGVGVAVAVAVGLAVRDGRGELALGLVGVTVGAYVDGVTAAGLVLVPAGEVLGGPESGLTQR